MNLITKLLLERQKASFLFLFVVLSNLIAAGDANAQTTRRISGTVLHRGEPLIGTTVMEKGTTNGTITDLNGKFSLQVKENAVLTVSYMGYKDVNVDVGTETVFLIEMEEDEYLLDEVVAIGYGVQKKKLVTGATVQVKGDDIARLNTVSAFGALQSQTPGVNITKTNGKPGEGFKVIVRGIGTVGNSNPLYVIDGVPAGDGSDAINNLNPADIESIDILKDAASAAIYGARAANGVILVTTKQGKQGKPSIQYDGYTGWQNVYKKLTPLNARQYMEIVDEASGITNNFFGSMSDYDRQTYESGAWNGTNWLDEMMLEDAPISNHTLNITGGTDKSTYSIGLGYTSQAPIIGVKNDEIDPKFERYTIRMNSEHNLIKLKDYDLLQFGQTLALFYKNSDGMGMATGNMYWNDVRNALTANPLYHVYKEDGGFSPAGWNGANEVNPIASMYYKRSFVNSKNYSARGNFYATLQPVKNLKYRASFGFGYSGWQSREYEPRYDLGSTFTNNGEDRISQGAGNGLSWTFDHTLSYDFNLLTNHNFGVMAGMSAERWGLGADVKGTNYNSQFDDFEHAYLENVKTVTTEKTSVSGNPWGEAGLLSYFGRLNYDYKGTYMGTFVMRRDGSANFAKGKRWGTFPSISGGWIVSNESFMENAQSWLDFLKIRASWGQNGNQSIDNFQYSGLISLGGSSNYYFGNDKSVTTIGTYPGIGNPDITWETSEQFNAGFDARFFNKLGVNFDYYIKTTKDWLVQAPVLSSTGFTSMMINGGNVRNQGVELALNWNDNVQDFRYSVSANVSYNQNKVMRIDNEEGIIHGSGNILSFQTGEVYRAQVGYPIGYFYGYKADGVIQTAEEAAEYDADHKIYDSDIQGYLVSQPGDIKYADTNNDGEITDADRTMIGNPHPDFTFGLSINLAWKNFDFLVTGSGVAGNQIMQSYRSFMNMPNENYTTGILNRWTGEGSSNRLPRITPGSLKRNWARISDQLFVEDGDYFRISNITLGYDFSRLFKQPFPLAQFRIYGAVQNLATFTKYSGMDPEIGYGGDASWVKGIDLGYYPSARTYLVGLTVKY